VHQFIEKYFSNQSFIPFAQAAYFMHERCLVGRSGYAFLKATESPMSMMQTTPILSDDGGAFPLASASILAAGGPGAETHSVACD